MRPLSRREVLKIAGVATVASVATPTPVVADLLNRLLGMEPAARPTSPITPNDEFYVTSYRSPPAVRVDDWGLSVRGLVARPITFGYSELLARPAVKQIVTLECVGNTVGGEYISTAEWRGVLLREILHEAGLDANAYDVVFRAADGYSDSITVERAMAGEVMIAYKMNGVPLPQGHGFPARIIVPDVYGMKSVQWLTDIEVVERDYLGYYQKKGWSDEAIIKTMSRIDVPGHGAILQGRAHVLQGIAFAGSRGVGQVDVSTDEGMSWHRTELEPALSPWSWVRWRYDWAVPAPGRYTLMVRATDGTGWAQTSAEQDPAPDGASGLHEVTVRIEG
jgi:DMSO/TMAO reductase YedYZ molybdopterin-dependent catalytic subunit